MFLSPWTVFPVVALLSTTVKAQNTIDLSNDVGYYPQDAWLTQLNPACNSVAQYTQVINSTATFEFTGNRFQIAGLGYRSDSFFEVLVDNQLAYSIYSRDVSCSLLTDYYVSEGTHEVVISLLGTISGDYNATAPPALYLNQILYWSDDSQGISPSDSAKHIGAIVGSVFAGLAGLGFIILGLFYYFKRRMPWSRKGRHSFDPTAANRVHIIPVELSPTKTTFQPYSHMEDSQSLPPEDTKYGVVDHSGDFSSDVDKKTEGV